MPSIDLLRHYQSAAVSAVRAHWAAGTRRVVVVLPTGAGKTVVAAALLRGARAPLAIVHTNTLLAQTRRRLGPTVRVETVQGLLARGARLDAHDIVFCDECHHLPSVAWSRVMALLSPAALVVGMTATPERSDGTGLGELFGALVSTAAYSDLLAAGHLAPCRVVPTTGMLPADAYLEHGQRRPGILFAPSIADCARAVATLTAAGVRAAAIDCTTPARWRAAAFTAYAVGGLDVLASPMALAEGFDSPRAEVCVLDRTCVHAGIYLQTAGRVLRPHPGKREAVLLDCRGASERHGSPTDDRAYSLEGTAIRRPAPPAAATGAPAAPRRASGVVPRPAPPAVTTGRAIGSAIGRYWRSLWEVRRTG